MQLQVNPSLPPNLFSSFPPVDPRIRFPALAFQPRALFPFYLFLCPNAPFAPFAFVIRLYWGIPPPLVHLLTTRCLEASLPLLTALPFELPPPSVPPTITLLRWLPLAFLQADRKLAFLLFALFVWAVVACPLPSPPDTTPL